MKHVNVGGIDCGGDDLFLISGPCVIEDRDIMVRTAEHLRGVQERTGIPIIFKSSFTKDNRSSAGLLSGPWSRRRPESASGDQGAVWLSGTQRYTYARSGRSAAEVLDVIQIPHICACRRASL